MKTDKERRLDKRMRVLTTQLKDLDEKRGRFKWDKAELSWLDQQEKKIRQEMNQINMELLS